MPIDYETRTTDANAQAAATLTALLGIPVTVDRHGVVRINATLLLSALVNLADVVTVGACQSRVR
jgi:hypothetical protein